MRFRYMLYVYTHTHIYIYIYSCNSLRPVCCKLRLSFSLRLISRYRLQNLDCFVQTVISWISLTIMTASQLNVHGPLDRYVKLQLAHAPGMPRKFSPPSRIGDPHMHQGTCVTHVPWCMSGSLAGGFLWSRWRKKPSRHSRRMRKSQFYVSGKRPMAHLTYSPGIMHRFAFCFPMMWFGAGWFYPHPCELINWQWDNHTIPTFGNRYLSAIGGGKQRSRLAGWVQLSAVAAQDPWPPRSTASATLCRE